MSLLADFVVEVGDCNRRGDCLDLLKRPLIIRPRSGGIDQLVLTPAFVTQDMHRLLVAVEQPALPVDVGFARLRRA